MVDEGGAHTLTAHSNGGEVDKAHQTKKGIHRNKKFASRVRDLCLWSGHIENILPAQKSGRDNERSGTEGGGDMRGRGMIPNGKKTGSERI